MGCNPEKENHDSLTKTNDPSALNATATVAAETDAASGARSDQPAALATAGP